LCLLISSLLSLKICMRFSCSLTSL